ncbi:hypothetical protein NPIL_318841 [Nephila pilipes]|uniref:Uncharacterized protein n=1 Tax=Nephila pilipes TaxID=299642 RepID=A0A8X6TQY0_NEPPI|nr:hypothetical protein NPIL_318841 [Nephila pilipes]
MLEIFWSLEKLQYYVYAREVTDHKPLESIKKSLQKAPKRFKTMLTRTQKYNYKLIYNSGKNFPISDTLSVASLEEISESSASIGDIVNSVNILPIRGSFLKITFQHPNEDEEMLALKGSYSQWLVFG